QARRHADRLLLRAGGFPHLRLLDPLLEERHRQNQIIPDLTHKLGHGFLVVRGEPENLVQNLQSPLIRRGLRGLLDHLPLGILLVLGVKFLHQLSNPNTVLPRQSDQVQKTETINLERLNLLQIVNSASASLLSGARRTISFSMSNALSSIGGSGACSITFPLASFLSSGSSSSINSAIRTRSSRGSRTKFRRLKPSTSNALTFL